jgi:hypothetical protein
MSGLATGWLPTQRTHRQAREKTPLQGREYHRGAASGASMLPTSSKTSLVATGLDTGGEVAAGTEVQASTSAASATPPGSHTLRRISARRVHSDRKPLLPGSALAWL